MKVLLLSIFILLGISCSSDPSKPEIYKTVRTKVYSTKIVNNQIIKDSLEAYHAIGCDSTGKQTYFVDLAGSSVKNDTSWSHHCEIVKKQGNKTFCYDAYGKIESISVKQGDTIYMYSGEDSDNPTSYQVVDGKGTMVFVDLLWNKRTEYQNREFDKKGNIVFCVAEESYFPGVSDKHSSKGEILRKEAQSLIKEAESHNKKIIENVYEYY